MYERVTLKSMKDEFNLDFIDQVEDLSIILTTL